MCSGGSEFFDKAKRECFKNYEGLLLHDERIFKAEFAKAMETLNCIFKIEKNKKLQDIFLRIIAQLTTKFQTRKAQKNSDKLKMKFRADTVKLKEDIMNENSGRAKQWGMRLFK